MYTINDINKEHDLKKKNLNKELEENPNIHNYWERLFLIEEETKIKINKAIYMYKQK